MSSSKKRPRISEHGNSPPTQEQLNEELIRKVDKGGSAATVLRSVRFWLRAGADGETILEIATKRGYVNVVKLLLEKGANPNVSMYHAAEYGHVNVMKLLLEYGGELEYGDDLNERLRRRHTILTIAAENGHLNVVRLLLEKGANPNDKDSLTHFTALMLAAQKGHVKVVDLLLEKGADINAINERSPQKYTALMLAVHRGKINVVELLLEKYHVDPNVLSPGSEPLLTFAMRVRNLKMVRLLVNGGADPTTLFGGRTAITQAISIAIERVNYDFDPSESSIFFEPLLCFIDLDLLLQQIDNDAEFAELRQHSDLRQHLIKLINDEITLNQCKPTFKGGCGRSRRGSRRGRQRNWRRKTTRPRRRRLF